MEKHFEIIKANRIIALRIIENVSLQKLNEIPKGFRNNIAWNVAHLTVILPLLCYKLSGLEINVSDKMVDAYKKGTAPTTDMTQQELDTVKSLLLTQVDTLKEDYKNNMFTSFNTYMTSVNIELATIDDAIQFNSFHEGIHLGYILALKNLL